MPEGQGPEMLQRSAGANAQLSEGVGENLG